MYRSETRSLLRGIDVNNGASLLIHGVVIFKAYREDWLPMPNQHHQIEASSSSAPPPPSTKLSLSLPGLGDDSNSNDSVSDQYLYTHKRSHTLPSLAPPNFLLNQPDFFGSTLRIGISIFHHRHPSLSPFRIWKMKKGNFEEMMMEESENEENEEETKESENEENQEVMKEESEKSSKSNSNSMAFSPEFLSVMQEMIRKEVHNYMSGMCAQAERNVASKRINIAAIFPSWTNCSGWIKEGTIQCNFHTTSCSPIAGS